MQEVRQTTDKKELYFPPQMTSDEFSVIGTFIQSSFGIKMPPGKRVMLQSRLTKRLRAMNMSSYGEYQEYLFSKEGQALEVPFMLDAVTTNKTSFFREQVHFDYLSDSLLPAWMEKTGGSEKFSVWSAGCATGEEPYSLAMVLSRFAGEHPFFEFEILGSDISGAALEHGRHAVYSKQKIDDIPEYYRKSYLMRSRDRAKEQFRIVPELRHKVSFRSLNLMDNFSCPGNKKDVIFCRNVIIYFERPTQEALFKRCCDCLKPEGYLFIGHSETLNGMNLPLRQIRPTVYQRRY